MIIKKSQREFFSLAFLIPTLFWKMRNTTYESIEKNFYTYFVFAIIYIGNIHTRLIRQLTKNSY